MSQRHTGLDGSLVADREALISQHRLMASWQWQHPFIVGRYRCTRLGLVQTGWMSLLPSALHAFLPDPAQTRRCNSCSPSGRTNVLLQQHPQRGGAVRQRQRGCAVSKSDTRWRPKSFLISAPAFIPNDDVIPFRPSYHMAQTGRVLLSTRKHSDSHSSPIPLLPLSPSPTRLSGIQEKLRCLFNGTSLILQTPVSPIWPRTH